MIIDRMIPILIKEKDKDKEKEKEKVEPKGTSKEEDPSE